MNGRRFRHLVIFARRPVYGVGKRRLAAEVGDLEALRFQRAALGVLVERLKRDRRWRTWVAITPDRPPLNLAGATALAQGEGDLGRRLSRVLGLLPPGRVVIVGTDAPQVLGFDVASAFAALNRADAVFGPAADGGYWLVGLSAKLRRPAVFEQVRWSTPDALSDTLENLSQCQVALLRELEDVDDAQSLQRLHGGEARPLSLIPGPSQGMRRLSAAASKVPTIRISPEFGIRPLRSTLSAEIRRLCGRASQCNRLSQLLESLSEGMA